MISLDAIRTYYPEALHSFDRFLLREYIQHHILSIMFQGKHASKLVFLGGTCLRIIHRNQRFSEDLDFDHFGLTVDMFQEVTEEIRVGLELQGFEVEMRNVSKDAWHCYVRLPGILFQQGLSGHIEEKVLIQIDTEAHGFDYEPEQPLLNRLDVFFQLNATPRSVLLAQKCYAILNRKRNKGRDFFDVAFLLAQNVAPDYGYLQFKTGIASPDALRDALLNHCSKLDMAEMAADVRPFLFQPEDARKVTLFPLLIESAALS